MKWFGPLRLLARYVRAHTDIAQSLRRIADHVDPPGLTSDLPVEPLTVVDPREHTRDFASQYELELLLTAQLGRPPEAEELERALNGDLLDVDDLPQDLRAKYLRRGVPS